MPRFRSFSSIRYENKQRVLNYKIARLPNYKIRGQRGYILLILLLAVALLSIFSLKVIEDIHYQYQRDREEELIMDVRSEEHTSELQSRPHLVCRLLLEK